MKNPLYAAEHDEDRKPPMYNRQDIALMLHADNYARKHHDWPLVSSTEILHLNARLIRAAIHHSQFFDTTELLLVNNEHNIAVLRSPHDDFRQQFPFVDTILNAFPGKLIVAGGSVYKAFQSSGYQDETTNEYHYEMLGQCDVDFFFIDCTEQEVDTIIRFTVKLLKTPRDYVKQLIGEIKQGVEDGDYDDNGLCIDRCQNTTTIYYAVGDDGDANDLNYRAEYDWLDAGGKLQFIHRVYPSAASVIGGFDLGVCMGFYDGHDFYATPFGAWSIANQTIILDVSRRSTSFEYRITKYITRCNCRLLIVNGSSVEAYQHLGHDEKLKLRICRPFWPVKGLKTLSYHMPAAEKYAGVEERIIEHDKKARIPMPELNIDNDEDREFVNTIFKNFGIDEETEHDYKLLSEKNFSLAGLKQNLNRFTCLGTVRDGMSDYDGGEFHDFSIEESNGIFAAQGKLDCITWRSATAVDAFDKPLIRYKLHPNFHEGVQEYEDDSEVEGMSMYLDAARRWFSPEQIANLKAGPITPPQRLPIHPEIFKQYVVELRQRVAGNIALAQEKALQGITILMENPGRQWTASRNPLVSDVRDYYHPILLQKRGPLLIGISHEVYALLRLAQLKSDSVWRWLPKDVLKLILATLIQLLAEDGTRLLLREDDRPASLASH